MSTAQEPANIVSKFCDVTGIRTNTKKTIAISNAGVLRFQRPTRPEIRVTRGLEVTPPTVQTIKYDMGRVSNGMSEHQAPERHMSLERYRAFVSQERQGLTSFQTDGIYVAGELIKPVPHDQHWRYLGAWMSADMDWGYQQLKAAEAVLPLLGRFRGSSLRPRQVRILINSVIIPRIVYPGTVIGFTNCWVSHMEKQIRITGRAAIRAVSGLCCEALHGSKIFCGINELSAALGRGIITHGYVRINTLPTTSVGAASAIDSYMSFAKTHHDIGNALRGTVTGILSSKQGSEEHDDLHREQADEISEARAKEKTIDSQQKRIASYKPPPAQQPQNPQQNPDPDSTAGPNTNPNRKRKRLIQSTLTGAKVGSAKPKTRRKKLRRQPPTHINKQSTLRVSAPAPGAPRAITVNNQKPPNARGDSTTQLFRAKLVKAARTYETNTKRRKSDRKEDLGLHKELATNLNQAHVQYQSVSKRSPKFEQPFPLYHRTSRYARALHKNNLTGHFRQSPGKSNNPVHNYPGYFDCHRKFCSKWKPGLRAYFSPGETDESEGLQHLIKHGITLLDLATNDGKKLRPHTKTISKLSLHPMRDTTPGTINITTYYQIHHRLTEYQEQLRTDAISPIPVCTCKSPRSNEFVKGDAIATHCTWDETQGKWGAHYGTVERVSEDDEGKVYHVLGFSRDINGNTCMWGRQEGQSALHPEIWPEDLHNDVTQNSDEVSANTYTRTWVVRPTDGLTLIDAKVIKRRRLIETIGDNEAQCIHNQVSAGMVIEGYRPGMLGNELAARNRGFTDTVAAVLGCIASRQHEGESPRQASRYIANVWWPGATPERHQPNPLDLTETLEVLEKPWCPGSAHSRFCAHSTLLELMLWVKQSSVSQNDLTAHTPRKIAPRRNPNGSGRWTPPPLTGDEAIPLPRGTGKLTEYQERINPMATRNADGKFARVTIATDGGCHLSTREGTAASTTKTELLTHTRYDSSIETASPLPCPCDSSTEAGRFGHLQADVTIPQQIPLHVLCDAQSAIALNAKSVANVSCGRELTVRRKITRRFHPLKSACEAQLRHRIQSKHPIPTMEWVKAHTIDQQDPQALSPSNVEYGKNRRADSLCEFAKSNPPPTAYQLSGQPKHYLCSSEDGKPLMHGPQHILKAQKPQEHMHGIRRHRRRG